MVERRPKEKPAVSFPSGWLGWFRTEVVGWFGKLNVARKEQEQEFNALQDHATSSW